MLLGRTRQGCGGVGQKKNFFFRYMLHNILTFQTTDVIFLVLQMEQTAEFLSPSLSKWALYTENKHTTYQSNKSKLFPIVSHTTPSSHNGPTSTLRPGWVVVVEGGVQGGGRRRIHAKRELQASALLLLQGSMHPQERAAGNVLAAHPLGVVLGPSGLVGKAQLFT